MATRTDSSKFLNNLLTNIDKYESSISWDKKEFDTFKNSVVNMANSVNSNGNIYTTAVKTGANAVVTAVNTASKVVDTATSVISTASKAAYDISSLINTQPEKSNIGKVNKKKNVNHPIAKASTIAAPDIAGGNLREFGVMNTPYMFNTHADPKIGSWCGRAYYDHILSNSPLIIFRVGKPKYMKGNSAAAQASLSNVLDSDDEEVKAQYLNNLFANNGGKNSMYYYTFDDSTSVFNDYCNYVNTMVRFTALRMDLNDYKSWRLQDSTIFSSNKGFFKTLFGSALSLSNFISFYGDAGGTSVSEAGSNNTTSSQMASSVKSLGQTKREVDFLFGQTNSSNTDDVQKSFDTYKSGIEKAYAKLNQGVDGILNKLGGMFTSISSGANVLFPEIWEDSSYRNNYSIEIKLSTPYGDPKSVFEDIYIPFFCLLALTLPRQSGLQGYVGPFLVQAFSKGWFSCNLGMVESMDVKKGGTTEWTIDNLPTEIDVNLNIKDLYPTIVASTSDANIAFGNNLGLQNYLKVMSGVQLTDFDPTENLQFMINSLLSTPEKIGEKIYTKVTSKLGNGAKAAIKSIFGGLN